MGGAACTIIIIGNELKGDVAGLYELLIETDLAVTDDEKREIGSFLYTLKTDTENYLRRVTGEDNGVNLQTVIHGIQTEGNLSAICDSAVNSLLSEEVKDDFADYLARQKYVIEKMLDKFRRRAEKEEYK